MSLIVKQSCCYPGNKNNEDYLYQGKDSIIVLDGSTNLFELDKKIDAEWYVKNFIKQYNLLNDGSRTLIELLKEAVRRMKILHTSITGQNPDEIVQKTSASIALVHERNGMFHFFSLGDCSILIDFKSRNRAKELIRIEDVSTLDDKVINRMIEIHKKTGIDIIKTKEFDEIKYMLIQNRNKMNKSNGYWVLGFDETAIDHGLYKIYTVEEVSQIIIFSDGFNSKKQSIIDKDFFDIEKLYKDLREQENKDKGCNKMPRLKKSDDATLVVIEVASQ